MLQVKSSGNTELKFLESQSDRITEFGRSLNSTINPTVPRLPLNHVCP